MRRNNLRLAVAALVSSGVVGCAAPAHLSGRWVYLTNGGDHPVAVGQSDQPSGGGPLHLVPGSPAAGACLPIEEYDRSFGPTCEHESEGDAPSAETYVRWYCGGDVAVRVRLEPCEERRDRVRVAEIAIATEGP